MAYISSRKNLLTFCLLSVLAVISLLSSTCFAMSILGGQKEISSAENDLELEELAKFALDQHNSRKNSELEFVELVSAKQHVVAGIMYHLNLKAAFGGRVDIYEARVWVKPWQNFKSLEEFKIVESPITQSDLGAHIELPTELGLRPVPLNDPSVKEAASEALKVIQERSNSLVPYELKDILSAHAQVNDDSTNFNIIFKVHRGAHEEHFKADLLRTMRGAWSVKDIREHH